MSTADTTPITAARFAAAITELSVPSLHTKLVEIRNSIAALQYSNDQMRPYADAHPADQDCVDAIAENIEVVARMEERIALIREEVVAGRGVAWEQFSSLNDTAAPHTAAASCRQEGEGGGGGGGGALSLAWTDGTFQTGTIRNGELRMDDGGEEADIAELLGALRGTAGGEVSTAPGPQLAQEEAEAEGAQDRPQQASSSGEQAQQREGEEERGGGVYL